MEISIATLISISGGILAVGGAVITFFQMQTRQNMKIDNLEKSLEKLEKVVASQGHSITVVEKAIVQINTKLDMLLEAIQELKSKHND